MRKANKLGLVFLTIALASPATAADKKAEGDMRWALNYCKKVFERLDRAVPGETSPALIGDLIKAAEPDHQKFLDYMEAAKAKDATVVDSTTVFDRKVNVTFADYHQRCLTLDARLEALRAARAGKNAEREAQKAAETAQAGADEQKRLATAHATDAVWGTCSGFRGLAGSSGVDARIAAYEEAKQQAVAAWPAIVDEPYTVDLKTTPEDPGTKTTKSFGEWFSYCDGMMPAHSAAVRTREAEVEAKSQAEAAERKAANDRIRKEQAAAFAALVAATGGERKSILQSKGFLPWWPRGGDLKAAPVWKWQIAITHEPVRCETFEFAGNKLKRRSTALGGCP